MKVSYARSDLGMYMQELGGNRNLAMNAPISDKRKSPGVARREFIGAVAAGSIGLAMGAGPRVWGDRSKDNNRKVYDHRVQFGAWINDMRNEVLPRDNWPAKTLDEITERNIIECLDLGEAAGFNQLDVFGLFATSSYPVDIRSAFTDKERRKRVDRILKAAKDRKIKIIFGLGVYSWGFDEIIKYDPAVQGPNKHAMCGSSPASLEWQKKLIDVIISELDVDGFHLESADQGRCNCPKCEPVPNVAYHAKLNIDTADYIKNKHPDKLASCIILGWGKWGQDFTDEEKKQLVNLSSHIDVLWDQGHRQPYVPPENRKAFIDSLKCKYGTSGGYWVYPPPRWHRLRWFLPYVQRTGKHIKELYEQGGRGVMFYQGPVYNPGVEVNIACGGRLLSDASQDTDEVLRDVLEGLYRPRTSAALEKLVQIYKQAEAAYFADWNEKQIEQTHKAPPPGEQHLGPLFGDSPGGPVYLSEPFLNEAGRTKYRAALLGLYDSLVSIEKEFKDGGRIPRMKQSIMAVVQDIDTLAMGKAQKG